MAGSFSGAGFVWCRGDGYNDNLTISGGKKDQIVLLAGLNHVELGDHGQI